MNIIQLEYLISFVQYGSYAGAAHENYVSRQAITKAISEIEKALGVQLTKKQGTNVVPTTIAYNLAVKAQEVINNFDDLADYAMSLKTVQHNDNSALSSLNILATSSPYDGTSLPDNDIVAFQKKHPDINLSVNYSSSASCLSELLCGYIDAAILFGRYNSGGQFTCIKLFEASLSLVVSQKHPLKKLKKIKLEDIASYPLGKPYDLGTCFPIIKDRLAKRGILKEFADPKVHIDDLNSFLHDRMGVGFIVSSSLLKNTNSDLAFLPLTDNDSIQIPVSILYNALTMPLSLFIQSFSGALLETYEQDESVATSWMSQDRLDPIVAWARG